MDEPTNHLLGHLRPVEWLEGYMGENAGGDGFTTVFLDRTA